MRFLRDMKKLCTLFEVFFGWKHGKSDYQKRLVWILYGNSLDSDIFYREISLEIVWGFHGENMVEFIHLSLTKFPIQLKSSLELGEYTLNQITRQISI